MGKKTLIQIFLITFLIVISFFIFDHFYVSKENPQSSKTTDLDNINTSLNNNDKNIIKDIEYSLNNNKGDIYRVIADFGEVELDNPDLMFLTNVTATVIFKDKSNIVLKSDYANFNTNTFETTFLNNVNVKRENELITGDELYLVLEQDEKDTANKNPSEENLIRISYNVTYKKPGYNLKADILELDLVTKNIKIYMLNKKEKILAKSIIK